MIRAALILLALPIAISGCASSNEPPMAGAFSETSQTYVYRSGAFTPETGYAASEPYAASTWTANAAEPSHGSAAEEYEYRGGRDPKTGRAKTAL